MWGGIFKDGPLPPADFARNSKGKRRMFLVQTGRHLHNTWLPTGLHQRLPQGAGGESRSVSSPGGGVV